MHETSPRVVVVNASRGGGKVTKKRRGGKRYTSSGDNGQSIWMRQAMRQANRQIARENGDRNRQAVMLLGVGDKKKKEEGENNQ